MQAPHPDQNRDDLDAHSAETIAKQSVPDQAPVPGNIDESKRHRTSLVQAIRSGVKLLRAMRLAFRCLSVLSPGITCLSLRSKWAGGEAL
jgi:hypothetical protein